ncbi:MAG TPA: polysaccharide deacetylase family protein [Anaerolineae bacterium]|nr:polysaccharide deacetylase family protein [Anaerolineae bacterium]
MNQIDRLHSRTAIIEDKLYRRLHRLFPQALWAGNPERREIALTFDDGPNPRDTLPLLEVLARHQATATFFNIGSRVKQFPHLTRAVAEAGHQIGLHGYYHRPFPLELPVALRAELDQFRALAVKECACDPDLLWDVRPPYGLFTPGILRLLAKAGYRPVMWSVVPHHRMQSLEATVAQITRHTVAGSILVLHEGWTGPPVAVVADMVIEQVKERGFRLITIDQMWRVRSVTVNENSP